MKGDTANYRAEESLRDQRSAIIRAIQPQDKGLIADALSKTSQDSIYLRFFSAKTAFSENEMSEVTEVDFENVVALVAAMEENGEERIVGGGRYICTPTGAEVAFLVQDDYHGLGIGSRIFKHLIIIARTAGIKQFEAEVLPGNKGMLTLFSRSGLPITQSRTSDAVHLKMALTTELLAK